MSFISSNPSSENCSHLKEHLYDLYLPDSTIKGASLIQFTPLLQPPVIHSAQAELNFILLTLGTII